MAKSKEQKKEILENLTARVKRAKSVVFTGFDGLGVKENEELRRGIKAEDGEYCVVKKTLLNIVFKNAEAGKDIDAGKFEGQIAAVFGYGDEVAPARIVDKFMASREQKLRFLGGLLGNKYLTAAEVGALAKLPGKTELYAQIVGSLNAPVSGFVNVLAGNLRGLVCALKAIGEKRAG